LPECSKCSKRDKCEILCEAVEKAITGRGKTASQKHKTYSVDFAHIVCARKELNRFQKKVLHTIMKLSSGIEDQLIIKLTLQEGVDKVLSGQEKRVFQLFMDQYKEEEIASTLGISQPRVNCLVRRARKKLKDFLKRGL